MLPISFHLATFGILVAFVAPTLAQTNKLFQWAFSNNALSTSLPTCVPLSIVVKSFDPTTNATHGTPPYYMMAFPVGGTPVTTLIGTDENNLSWTVTAPAGSVLVLSVVDANGSAGGIPPRTYTVIPGSTTQCVTTPLSPTVFTVKANVTGNIKTCQPWGLTVKGGVPPYVVTLAQLNSPVVTNVTIPFGDDQFTFINRADPGGQLIGAISDFTGRWATGTPIVTPTGSPDTSCIGLVSSSSNSALTPQTNASKPDNHRAVAIGLSITVLLLFAIFGGIAGFIYLRKRKRRHQAITANLTAHQFVEIESQMASVQYGTSNAAPPPTQSRGISSSDPVLVQRQAPVLPVNRAGEPISPSTAEALSYTPESVLGQVTAPLQPSPPPVQRPGFSRFPTSSIRRSTAKALEATMSYEVSPGSEYPVQTAISDASDVLGRQLSAAAAMGTSKVGRNIGVRATIAEEGARDSLPPPYMDQGGSGRPS